jgi:aminoglycoside phosphotransferase (APT) family kinase protein
VAVASVEQVSDSLERNLGCKVLEVRRQTRWRPCWFARVEQNGELLDLVVRGERVDTCIQPLRQEFKFHRLLEQHDIRVPRIHGWLEDIEAVAMERVPGKPDFNDVPLTERDRIVDEYLQQLAKLHSLDLEPFIAAGMNRGPTPAGSAVLMHYELERLWRSRKRHPNPFLEFCLGWLHRNPPRSQGRETPILWDSGQFHHHKGRLVALLDLEFGHIGDPMADLAVWRMRDTLIPFGDFNALYARYAALCDRPVDIEAIKRHHFAATLSNEMIFGAAVLDPVPETDLMNNMQWNSETNLHATEALCEFLELEPPTIEVPPAARHRTANTFNHLIQALKNLSGADEFAAHEIRLAFRTARHLARSSEIGAPLLEADLDDVHRILDHRPVSWREADAELERFVLADRETGKFDERLVWLFHRRNLRNHVQLGPIGSRMVSHYPTQRFDGKPPINTARFGDAEHGQARRATGSALVTESGA